MQQVPRRLARIIADHLDVKVERITMSAHLSEDLKAESLDLVEIMMACEEEFNLEITDSEARKMLRIKDLVAYLNRHGIVHRDDDAIEEDNLPNHAPRLRIESLPAGISTGLFAKTRTETSED